MRPKPARFLRIPLLFAFCSLLFALRTFAQTAPVQSRITQAVDESNLTVLKGNTYYLASAEYDRGVAPSSLPMNRMLLVLQRSPSQEATLEQLLDQQQDQSSPNYHQWLTPQQFGQQFGPSDQDIQTITSWLQSHGFQVAPISNGRTVIEFSGTAGQVQEAFHTAIHKYSVPTAAGAVEDHWANSSDPSIPTALTPVVAGVRSLHNFRARPMNHSAGTFHRDKDSGKILATQPLPIPQFTPGSQFECGILRGPCEALGPYDIATIYNVAPLWNAATPIDGTGQTIAIVGETDILPADWTAFWNMFGVASPKGSLKIILNGPDPGFQSDESEADIDTQWSSAVAKGATIDFVESQSTEATLGVDLSAEFIVDNNLAPVMSESYGACELFVGTAGNSYYNALWQQASAQGITVFISSGDAGSAVCDRGASSAQFGLAVSGFGSTSYNVAVGATDFNDLTTTSKYWSLTNNANQANAKGYIPEMTWNDTCTNSEIFPFLQPPTTTAEQTCNNPEAQQDNFVAVAGGSGGASNCTSSTNNLQSTCSGGYAKPSWQSAPGVPADNKRDVPDVSLFASNGFNNSFYIICQSDADGPCGLNSGDFSGFGGTSVSSPIFAGIMALINQKTGERQGNANYVFYKMAATASNSCNSNTVPSTGTNNCIFYDIPSGSTIAMPCTKGSPNCTTTNSGDQFGVLSGYSTGSGYDLATGLGSVNATNLVNQWSTYAGQFKASKVSSFTLGPPTTITHGQAIPVAAAVAPQTGTGTPTGTIALIANTGSSASNQQGAQQLFTLSGGSLPAGTTTTFLPGGTNYTVTARYSGDSTFAPSSSSPFTVTVNPEPSKTQAAIITFNPTNGAVTSSNATSFTYGSFYILRSNVTNASGNPCATNGIQQYGCPTGTVTLKDTFNGSTNPLDGGSFTLNSEGYTEDQPIFLLGGQHSIVASYGGDPSYSASNNSAAPDVVTVTKAATTISLSPATQNAQAGFAVSVTATVSTQASLPASPSPAEFPSNNVQFFVGGNPIVVSPSASSVNYSATINSTTGFAQLTAQLSTSTLPFGNNTITAQFVGDSNYVQSAVSNSAAISNQGATTTNITSSNLTIQHGASVTFTAVVASVVPGGPALTGTVSFTANGAPLGSPVSLVNGQAQVSSSSLPGGTLLINATYSGDTNYQASLGQLQEVVQLLATTTTVTTSNAAIQQGTSVTLTAQVTPVHSGGPALTGTVQFLSAVTSGGSTSPIGAAVSVSNGQAQLTTSSIPSGTQFVFGSYSGDSNYAASQTFISEQVTPGPDFSVSFAPAALNVSTPGASATTTVTVTGSNGYNGAITFSPAACSGLPFESSCSFSPATVTGSGTTALMVSTTAPSSLVPVSRHIDFGGWRTTAGAIRVLLLCAALLALAIQARRRRWNLASSVLMFTLLIGIAACGGGGGGGSTGPTNPGTPVVQNQTITVTATSGTTTHTFTFTLNVN
ncbi:MAG TPA: Ig-like domain repeat protein [Candidatus Acidoferrales bacterium]